MQSATSHHLCYVGGNHLHSLYELFFSFLNYLLRSLTPSWLFFHLFGPCRLASQIPRGSRYLYLESTTYCLHPIIVPLNLENKSIMHVCKNRKKNKSSSLSSIDLVNNLLRSTTKIYRSSPNYHNLVLLLK